MFFVESNQSIEWSSCQLPSHAETSGTLGCSWTIRLAFATFPKREFPRGKTNSRFCNTTSEYQGEKLKHKTVFKVIDLKQMSTRIKVTVRIYSLTEALAKVHKSSLHMCFVLVSFSCFLCVLSLYGLKLFLLATKGNPVMFKWMYYRQQLYTHVSTQQDYNMTVKVKSALKTNMFTRLFQM